MKGTTRGRAISSRSACHSYIIRLLLVLAAVAAGLSADAQHNSVVQALKEHRAKALQEKLFLHLDRPLYACGETMWFKIYAVDGTLHQPLPMSKVAYVEVLDEAQQPVLQGKISLKEATGTGSFVLPVTLSSGNYTVRAYTSWMKNFSPEFYFEQPVTILNTYQKPGLQPVAEAAYSLQFFPEGGQLVAGLESKVAFKVTERTTAKGAAATTGEVLNAAGEVVATFAPAQFGIGHFAFRPVAGEAYTAVLKLAETQVLTQPLPQVYEQGYVLAVQEEKPYVLKIRVQAAAQQSEQVYLLGHARQQISVAEAGRVENGEVSFRVPKEALADGITHFTLFNSSNQPVCERLYFKRPEKTLAVAAQAAKEAYARREKVELAIQTSAAAGVPAPANLSVAVYRLDDAQAATGTDISAYLWLTSELKGQVENPGWYLSDTSAHITGALDNLMLTHGWSRFRWEEVLGKKTAAYAFVPEYDGHLVQGRITHAPTGAPAPHLNVYLAAPSRHVRLYNARSDANGGIRFEVKDFFGQKEVVVQTDSRSDSTYRFEIFSPFSERFAQQQPLAFVLPESLHHAIGRRHQETEAQQLYFRKFRDRYKAAGVDSISFYGVPDQQYYLDDYTRFKVMEEVMREYVPGVLVRKRGGRFHFKVVNAPVKAVFDNDPLVLLDGVPVFDTDKIMAFDPLKVQRLDVITNNYFQGHLQYEGVVSYTTYKGDLAGFPLDPHTLLMEYEGLQLEREFYAPAYDTPEQLQSRLPDFRNLLHWAPAVKTKSDGKAALTFYTSDSAGTYLVVVQGLANDGRFGSKMFTFEVKQPL